MQRSIYRGPKSRSDDEIPRPKRLAIATTTVQQSGTAATAVDVSGAAISFTVGWRYEVEVEFYMPWIIAATALVNGFLIIADQANVVQEYGLFEASASGSLASCIVKERITVPGSYSRKGQVARSSGTGTITTLANLDTVTAFIKATEIQA